MLTTRRRGIAAFTLIELLVVMFLSVLFGLMITEVVRSTSQTSQHLLHESEARDAAHTALTDLQRALRGARALGACWDSGQAVATPLSNCQRVGEYDAATDPQSTFVQVTPSSMIFYAYDANEAATCNRPATGTALLPPERVQVTVDPSNELWVRRWCPNPGATYTDARTTYAAMSLNKQPDASIDGGHVADPNIFTFYDTTGQPLTKFDSTGSLTNPGSLAMVEVAPKFVAGIEGVGHTGADFTADVTIPLSVSDPNGGAGQ